MESVFLDWDIDNPIFCLEKSNGALLSPEFLLNSLKCTLIFKVDFSKDTVSIGFQEIKSRLESSRTILIDLAIIFQHDTKCIQAMSNRHLHTISYFEDCFPTFMKYSDLKERFVRWTRLKILCNMNVYILRSDGAKQYFEFTKNVPGFRKLSDDFRGLYESKCFSDLVIKLNDGELPAHKAILAARSKDFALKLKPSGSAMTIEDLTREEFSHLLSFIYAGNVELTNYMARHSWKFFRLVQRFAIPELESLLDLAILKAETHICVKSCRFDVEILNFKQYKSCTIIYSVRETAAGCEWVVEIDVGSNDIGIFLKRISEVTDGKQLVKLIPSLLRSTHPQPVLYREGKYFQVPKVGQRIGFSNFISLEKIYDKKEKFLEEDCLNVRFDLFFTQGDVVDSSEGVEEQCYRHNKITQRMELTPLFNEGFKKLFEEGTWSDMIVAAGGKSFNVHRAILAARSQVFANMFKELNQNENFALNISAIGALTLEKMLVYIYAGEIGKLCSHTAIELYLLAEKYSLIELRKYCSGLLPSLLNTANACKILVMAHLHEDLHLKQYTEQFIRNNFLYIISTTCWSYLIQNFHGLAEEICNELGNSDSHGSVDFGILLREAFINLD